jgi:uncharacterized membrane protein
VSARRPLPACCQPRVSKQVSAAALGHLGAAHIPPQHPAIAIYGLNLIAVGLTLALQWWYATTETRHVDPDIHPALVRRAMRRTLMAPLVYVVAIALSLVRTELSLILYALVPLLYILPGRIDIHWGRRAPNSNR